MDVVAVSRSLVAEARRRSGRRQHDAVIGAIVSVMTVRRRRRRRWGPMRFVFFGCLVGWHIIEMDHIVVVWSLDRNNAVGQYLCIIAKLWVLHKMT